MLILGALLTGDIVMRLLFKSNRRIANANADVAETQATTGEFHLLKEQIEMNQQQNLDLIKINAELVEQIKEKENRFAEQTDKLRESQRNLLAATDREVEYVKRIGELELELEKKRCDTLTCPFRQPPNAYTPPQDGITIMEYHNKD